MESGSLKTQEDWIDLNHSVESQNLEAVQTWFSPEKNRSKPKLQLFTNIRNPVSLAAILGGQEVFHFLVAEGFDPQTPDQLDDPWHRRPIHLAASSGHGDLVQALITKHGVDVDSRDETGRTVLHWAAVFGHTELAKLLLSFGAGVNSTQADNSTPLHYAAEASHAGVCKVLMSNGADVNLKDSTGLSPLHYAVRAQSPASQSPSKAAANHESLC